MSARGALLLLCLAGCATSSVVSVASAPATDPARSALNQCLRRQHLTPCSEMEASWVRGGCASRRASDPTLREGWYGDRLYVDVRETDDRVAAQFTAPPGDVAAAEIGARTLDGCFRALLPDTELAIETREVPADAH